MCFSNIMSSTASSFPICWSCKQSSHRNPNIQIPEFEEELEQSIIKLCNYPSPEEYRERLIECQETFHSCPLPLTSVLGKNISTYCLRSNQNLGNNNPWNYGLELGTWVHVHSTVSDSWQPHEPQPIIVTLSMGFSEQQYWSALPFPWGSFQSERSNLCLLSPPVLAGGLFTK